MRINENRHVLAVPDLQRTRDWFERVLGCTTQVIDNGNWLYFTRDTVTFMCGQCPDAINPEQLGDHQYFAYLIADDLDAFHQQAINQNAIILKHPTQQPWGTREMALQTIDGHRLMLAQHPT